MNIIGKEKPKMTVSVRDLNSDRQANNLFEEFLPMAVRPWFEQYLDDEVASAIDSLAIPGSRDQAARFLGLELLKAA